jgi:hypothetical protein
MNSLNEIWRLKNSYTNKKERLYFSVQAVVCNAETSDIYDRDNECASVKEIDHFL